MLIQIVATRIGRTVFLMVFIFLILFFTVFIALVVTVGGMKSLGKGPVTPNELSGRMLE